MLKIWNDWAHQLVRNGQLIIVWENNNSPNWLEKGKEFGARGFMPNSAWLFFGFETLNLVEHWTKNINPSLECKKGWENRVSSY